VNVEDLVKNPEKVNELLEVLDEIARDVSSYEYGLPMYDDAAKARLREAVYQWSCNALTPQPTLETSGDCISCSVGNPGVYIKDGSMVCPHRPALNTSPSPAFVGSLCAHVPKGFACEICNHDGEQE
jgi:hypothetical protein